VLPLRQSGLAIQLRLLTKATLLQLKLMPKRIWKLSLRHLQMPPMMQTQTKPKQMLCYIVSNLVHKSSALDLRRRGCRIAAQGRNLRFIQQLTSSKLAWCL
jgi:hypothetical protein